MAQGGIVSFEPAGQPGAYQATMADGSQQTFFGPSADDFYKRRQASAALGPNALAQNDAQQPQMGPPPPPTASDVPTNPVTRLPGGGVSIPIEKARAITRGEKVIPEPPKPTAPGEQSRGKPSDVPENPKAAGPSGGPRIGEPLGYTMKAVDEHGKEFEGPAIMTADGPRVLRAGTRGSKGGLTGLGKDLVERQTETGHAIAQGREMEAAGISEGTRLASEDAQQQFDYLKEQQRQTIIQQHQQEEENRQLEERVQKMDASYQAARDEFKSSKVDAGRYMRGNWMAVLGSALGAAGAALARTPNFAMDFVSQNIDRDIRSQEREIEVKGKSADNALADLTRSQGSLQAGKGALKQLLLEKASNQAGMIASSTKTQAVKAEALRLAGQLQQQYAASDLERTKGYVDQVYKDRTYYSPGSAGTSGGLFTPTLGSITGAQDIDKNAANIDKTRADAAKTAADAKAEKEKAVPRGLLRPLSATDSTLMLGKNLLDAYGVKPGQKVGYMEGQAVGAGTVADQERARKIDSNLGNFLSEVHVMISNSAPTESDKQEFAEKIKHWSTAQKIDYINNGMELAKHKRQFIESQRGSSGGEADDSGAADQ